MKTVIALAVVLTTALPVSAETMLYLNKDNKSWTGEKTFTSSEDCERAARNAISQKLALGAGCAPHVAPVIRPQGASPGDEPFGARFQESQRQQQAQEQANRERAAAESRRRLEQQEAERRADQRAREQGREQGRELYNCIRSRGAC